MATKTVVRYRNRPKAKTRRRANKFSLPIAVVAPLASNIMTRTIPAIQSGSPSTALKRLTFDYTGYDPNNGTWNMYGLKQGAIPLIVGLMVHKVAGKLGVNRAIARAGVPWIRI